MRLVSTARLATQALGFGWIFAAWITVASVGCIPDELKLLQHDAASTPLDASGDGVAESSIAEAEVDQGAESQPESDAGPSCSGSCSVVLASGQGSPRGIVVDATRLYWTNFSSNRVMSCAVQGCNNQTTILADGQPGASGIAMAGASLYWIRAGDSRVMKCPIATCSADIFRIADGQGSPAGIFADSLAVWWTNSSSGELMSYLESATGQPAVALSKQNHPVSFARRGNFAFWVNAGSSAQAADGEVRWGKVGSSSINEWPAISTGEQGPTGLAVDEVNVYWTSVGSAPGTGKVSAYRYKNNDGPIRVLADQQAEPLNIAVDSDRVVWTNSASGQVMACSIQGCGNQPSVLASGQVTPWGIAVDASSIYWTDSGTGQVLKLVK